MSSHTALHGHDRRLALGRDSNEQGVAARGSLRAGRYLVIGMAVVLGLMAAIVAVAVYSSHQVDQSARSQLIGDAFPLRKATGDLVTDVTLEQSELRGYLIDGTAANLERYQAARESVAADLRALQPRLAGNARIARLGAMAVAQVGRLNAYATSEIDLAAGGAADRRAALADIGTGDSLMHRFAGTAAQLDAAAAALARQAEDSQSSTYHRMVVLVLVMGAIALGLGAIVAAVLLRVIAADARRLERAAGELELRNTELERSNAQLQEFAYVASHDLSEPLRAVAGFAQLLRRRYRGRLDADADEFIEFIVDGVDRMQRLITDLLEYSRAGRGELQLRAVDTGAVVRRTLDTLSERIAETKADVEVGPLPAVQVDEVQIERVFQNLIGNALKFVRDEPVSVRITAARSGDRWQFSVCDTGIGVPPEHAERIFRMFQRLHGRDSYAGTGVGLAVSKTIVERHGGEIWVTPNTPAGSCFRFTIPDRKETT
jgi:signal transduction histidine kinase